METRYKSIVGVGDPDGTRNLPALFCEFLRTRIRSKIKGRTLRAAHTAGIKACPSDKNPAKLAPWKALLALTCLASCATASDHQFICPHIITDLQVQALEAQVASTTLLSPRQLVKVCGSRRSVGCTQIDDAGVHIYLLEKSADPAGDRFHELCHLYRLNGGAAYEDELAHKGWIETARPRW